MSKIAFNTPKVEVETPKAVETPKVEAPKPTLAP